MRRWLRLGIAGGMLLAVAGCGRKTERITVAGSTAFQPFAERLAESFMAAHPEVDIAVQGGGSAMGVQSALSGTADIGMADLVELPPEAASLHSTVVARDGISVIVNPANPLSSLTVEQIRAIFNGQTRNWSEVGGRDHAITVVSREAGSGTRTSFEGIIKGINLTPEAIFQDSSGTIRETVANDANAIGYISHGVLNDKIKDIEINTVRCTAASIREGAYPLVRPVFLLTRGVPEGNVKAFIDYMLSDDGQAIIQANGLIPAK